MMITQLYLEVSKKSYFLPYCYYRWLNFYKKIESVKIGRKTVLRYVVSGVARVSAARGILNLTPFEIFYLVPQSFLTTFFAPLYFSLIYGSIVTPS